MLLADSICGTPTRIPVGVVDLTTIHLSTVGRVQYDPG